MVSNSFARSLVPQGVSVQALPCGLGFRGLGSLMGKRSKALEVVFRLDLLDFCRVAINKP